MNYAIILAGGAGLRAGGPLPKQFQKLGSHAMLWWSIEAFRRFDPACRIIVAVHPDFRGRWRDLLRDDNDTFRLEEILEVTGGKTRIESVKNALAAIEGDGDATVLIHDAARPFVTPELIARGAANVRRGTGMVPGIPLTDSIRRLTATGSKAEDRADFVAVQTPQVFICDDIRRAYAGVTGEEKDLTDDASVAERFGLEIEIYPGDAANVKITNPGDIKTYCGNIAR